MRIFTRSTPWRVAAACVVSGALHATGAHAADGLLLDGALAAHYSSGSAELDDQRNLTGATAFINASVRHGAAGARLESVLQIPDFGENVRREHRLRQGYVEYTGEQFDVRAGRQLIIWGRADRFNPTDYITPTDYGFLTADDQGQRFGATGVRARWFINEHASLIGIYLPVFRSSVLPAGVIPAGVPKPVELPPDVGFSRPQLGIKLDHNGAGLDGSLSWYHGYLTTPALTLDPLNTLALVNPRLDAVGGDFAATRGVWGVRGEAAYLRIRSDALPPGIAPRSNFYSVLGIERSFGEANTLLMEWLHRRMLDFTALDTVPAPLQPIARANAAIHAQLDRIENGVSVSLISRWRNDTVTTELAGAVLTQHRGFALRPKVSWAIDDKWKLTGVIELFRGPPDSTFGVLRRNSRLFVELRRSF
jgi:hypothetical protein